jgi:hypothetical protein
MTLTSTLMSTTQRSLDSSSSNIPGELLRLLLLRRAKNEPAPGTARYPILRHSRSSAATEVFIQGTIVSLCEKRMLNRIMSAGGGSLSQSAPRETVDKLMRLCSIETGCLSDPLDALARPSLNGSRSQKSGTVVSGQLNDLLDILSRGNSVISDSSRAGSHSSQSLLSGILGEVPTSSSDAYQCHTQSTADLLEGLIDSV